MSDDASIHSILTVTDDWHVYRPSTYSMSMDYQPTYATAGAYRYVHHVGDTGRVRASNTHKGAASLTLPFRDKTAAWCTASLPCIQTAQPRLPQALGLAAQIAPATFVWCRTGQSHDAGSMGATDGSFRPLATFFGTSERSLAKQPKPPAPTVARNLPEQRHETVTLCTTSASSVGTPEQSVSEVSRRGCDSFAFTYEEGGDT